MKKLILLSALLIFACGSDESSNSDDIYNSGLINCNGSPVPSMVYGTQEWTVENACHTTYRDGTPIPQVTDNDEWTSLTTGAWCYYDNDPNKGVLYNWYALAGIYDNNIETENKEFCPIGWHIPSDSEWLDLKYFIIDNFVAGQTSETIATSMASNEGWNFWASAGAPGYDQLNNNSSGFNAFPYGWREVDAFSGLFYAEGSVAIFWTSTQQFPYHAGTYYLDDSQSYLGNSVRNKSDGISVRLVKD